MKWEFDEASFSGGGLPRVFGVGGFRAKNQLGCYVATAELTSLIFFERSYPQPGVLFYNPRPTPSPPPKPPAAALPTWPTALRMPSSISKR